MANRETIFFDYEGIEEISDKLAATQKQIQLSIWRANARTTRAARKKILQVSKQITGVKQSKFKRRIFFYIDKKRGGYIWVGLNPIGLHWIGARQNRRGVKAGKHFRPGAFIPRKGGPVYKRVGSGRFPIKRETLEIDRDLNKAIDRALFAGDWIEEYFYREFERDLKWRTTK